jgi:hypothetical protein
MGSNSTQAGLWREVVRAPLGSMCSDFQHKCCGLQERIHCVFVALWFRESKFATCNYSVTSVLYE